MIFRTTEQILHSYWQTDAVNSILPHIKFEVTPASTLWNDQKNIEISDIQMWEQIYYKGAHVGIYAAWNPRVEFYLISYNLFLHLPQGIKTFYGPDAKRHVWKFAKDLNVILPVNKIWVENTESLDNSLDLL